MVLWTTYRGHRVLQSRRFDRHVTEEKTSGSGGNDLREPEQEASYPVVQHLTPVVATSWSSCPIKTIRCGAIRILAWYIQAMRCSN